MPYAEAVVQICSVNQVFLEISQNSQENTCARVSFLIKLQELPATILKKRLWYRCLPVNFVIFLRTPFLRKHLWWLLQHILRWVATLYKKLSFEWFLWNVTFQKSTSARVSLKCHSQNQPPYFAIFTGKHFCWSLFNKVAAL